MVKLQVAGMQKVAVESDAKSSHKLSEGILELSAVNGITDDRMFQSRQMKAELVRPSRLGLGFDQREAIQSLKHA
jgi:hypothetical protein